MAQFFAFSPSVTRPGWNDSTIRVCCDILLNSPAVYSKALAMPRGQVLGLEVHLPNYGDNV